MAIPAKLAGLLGSAALVAAGLGLYIFASDQGSDHLPEMVAVEMADGRHLFVSKYEVTAADWNRCADAGRCAFRINPRPGFDPEMTPATGVNWIDSQDYLAWINRLTRHPLRLPSTAEWEHLARDVMPEEPEPIFSAPELAWAAKYVTEASQSRALRPLGSFSTTSAGVADLDGPVWEWTADCHDPDRPHDRCFAFVAAGQHMAVLSAFTRDPARGGCAVGTPPPHLGLRLVSDRDPA